MKKILMVCESFERGVFTYVSQFCNDMIDEFEVYLAYSLRPQTPNNYKEFLDYRVHLIQIKEFGVKGLTSISNNIKIIKELCKIKDAVKPDIIHLHFSLAGGIGRLAFKGKNNIVVYTQHGYAHILIGKNKKTIMYGIMERILEKFFNAITLTCSESEDKVAKGLTKRTAYIETGVNLEDLSVLLNSIEPVKNEKFTVFTLACACIQKQPTLFNKIAELVPEAKFIWIGNGEFENELTAPDMEVIGLSTLF